MNYQKLYFTLMNYCKNISIKERLMNYQNTTLPNEFRRLGSSLKKIKEYIKEKVKC